MDKIVKRNFISKFLILILFTVFSCKENRLNKNQDLINGNTTPQKKTKNKFRKYSFLDKETNDYQEILISKINDSIIRYEIKVITDLCEMSDKSLARLQKGKKYFISEHPTIKKIIFVNDQTIKISCSYNRFRDECDPIQEFIMTLN